MIKAYNDHLLVELAKSKWTTVKDESEQDDPNAGYGTVVAVPDTLMWLSNYSWMAENTLLNPDQLEVLMEQMTALVGKKVYFEKRSEIGNVIEDGDKTYATIKFSKITAVEE